MNSIDLITLGKQFMDRYDKPTMLFSGERHAIYWLGTPTDTAFRSNTYLLVSGHEAFVIDPGGRDVFDFVRDRVSQVMNPSDLTGLIISHQDPDVAASMTLWLELNPQLQVLTTGRTNVILPHYGTADYRSVNVSDDPRYLFSHSHALRFIESPHLHSPGAFVTYDETSGFLFSSDIWAAVDMDWRLVVPEFKKHILKMNLFHIEYMASNKAARGFLSRIRGLDIKAILPQHGSIIPASMVDQALKYLSDLRCGTDLLYADIYQI